MRDVLNKIGIARYARFQRRVQLTHSFLMFLNELDSRFNNDVVEKAFHNSLCGILCVKIETSFLSSECFDPGVNKAPTDNADLAD